MNPISFVIKARFKLQGRVMQILRMSKCEDKVSLEVQDESGLVHTQSLEFLLNQYSKGNLRSAEFIQEEVERLSLTRNPQLKLLSDLGEKERNEGEKKAGLLLAISEEGGFHYGNEEFWEKRYPELCEEYGFAKNPHKSTIRRWAGKVNVGGELPLQLVLAPKNEFKGGKRQSLCFF